MTNNKFLAAAVAMAMAMTANIADASTVTGTMTVTASVAVSCSITAGTLAFGAYDTVVGAAVQGSTTLSVTCTKGGTATVTLGQGSNPASGSTDATPLRQMANSTNRLGYSLYQDSSRSVVWGNTGATGYSYTSTGNSNDPLTVYGTITASQNVPAGSYSDSVVATMTF
jgi:spore coat protein U-like protein